MSYTCKKNTKFQISEIIRFLVKFNIMNYEQHLLEQNSQQ